MRTPLCDAFGIEYPIFAFTPSEHVAAAVSRAGGLGVLGCVRFNDADELEQTLTWLDDNTDGKPYGVDVVMPMKIPTEGKAVDLKAMIPDGAHHASSSGRCSKLGVPPLPEGEGREGVLGWLHSVARSHVDVALAHRPVLIANALGSPPVDVIEKAHEHGVKVAALAGAAKHALSHVAERRRHHRRPGLRGRRPHRRDRRAWCSRPRSSTRSGPTCPCSAPAASAPAARSRPRWRSARRACGPARSGSTARSTEPLRRARACRDAFLRATSSDTVRTRIYTGKPARLLKTKWTEAWDEEDAPTPLPMPLQNLLVADAHNRMNRGDDPDVISMPVGQIVGRMNEVRPVAEVMADLVAEFEEAYETAERHSRELTRSFFSACLGNTEPRAGSPSSSPYSASLATVLGVGNLMSATGSSFPAPTPEADCGPGSRPETDIQGRVPARRLRLRARGARLPLQHPAGRPPGHQPAASRCSATATRRATSARSTTRPCCSRRTCCSTRPRASAWSCST